MGASASPSGSRRSRARSAGGLAKLAGLGRGARGVLGAVLRVAGQRTLADSLGTFGHTRTADYWPLVERTLDYRATFARAMDAAPVAPLDVIVAPPCAMPAF